MPRRAVDKLHAHILFQRRKRTADGLQRTIEPPGRLRQAPLLGNMNEGFKVFEAAHFYLEYRDLVSILANIVPSIVRIYTALIPTSQSRSSQ
ncbi:hypothetical protein FQZ97_761660 [compost metagenome]